MLFELFLEIREEFNLNHRKKLMMSKTNQKTDSIDTTCQGSTPQMDAKSSKEQKIQNRYKKITDIKNSRRTLDNQKTL